MKFLNAVEISAHNKEEHVLARNIGLDPYESPAVCLL